MALSRIWACMTVAFAATLSLSKVVYSTDATVVEAEAVFDGVELMASLTDAAYHREKILDRHNYLRSREAENGFGSGAVFMNRLVYDVELEAYARNYARHLCATGKWEHSPRGAPLRASRGENLYTNSVDYSATPSRNFDSAQIVQKWWDERNYFNWHSTSPSHDAQRQGKLVGHWTQVVRAEASTVGCWIVTGCQCKGGQLCNKANNGRWSTYVACHYDYGNLGQYPYWPLNPNLQYRIPSTVQQYRRQRCGNCPKGFSTCGTTVGGGEKRDAYLCVGYWDINEELPPADLLQRSITTRRSASGVPSWYFMIRNCGRRNGSCPSSSSCWQYGQGKPLTAEPPVLVNQCQCNGFSTQYGIYFERDMCGQYSARQPYYDADAFLAFFEAGGKSGSLTTDAESGLSPGQADRTAEAFLRGRRDSVDISQHNYNLPSFSHEHESEEMVFLETPPLMETEEQAADILIQSSSLSQEKPDPLSTAFQYSTDEHLKHVMALTGESVADTSSKSASFLSLEDIAHTRPPTDNLMFEWRGVKDPKDIATQQSVPVHTRGASTLQVGFSVQEISVHGGPVALAQLRSNDDDSSSTREKADDSVADPLPPASDVTASSPQETSSSGPDSSSDEESGGSEEGIGGKAQGETEEGTPAPEVVAVDDSNLSGAPVDVPAVREEARRTNKTPLPASAASQKTFRGSQTTPATTSMDTSEDASER